LEYFSNVIPISEEQVLEAYRHRRTRRSIIPVAAAVVEEEVATVAPDRITSRIHTIGIASRVVTQSFPCPPVAAIQVATRRRIKREEAMDAAHDPPAVGDHRRRRAEVEPQAEQRDHMAGMEPSRRYRVPLVVVSRRPLAAAVWWLGPSCRCHCRRQMHSSNCNNNNYSSSSRQFRHSSNHNKRSTRRKVCVPFPPQNRVSR